MIKVIVTKSIKGIEGITVSGHALSNDHGKDLVCAGVSAVMFGFINSFNSNDVSININDEESLINIKNTKHTEMNATLFNALLISLKTIEKTNKSFIKIEEK